MAGRDGCQVASPSDPLHGLCPKPLLVSGAERACTHSSGSSSPATSYPWWFARSLSLYPALFRASVDGKDSRSERFVSLFSSPPFTGFSRQLG